DAASVEDEHAVGQVDELRNLGRMEQHRPTGVGVGADEAIKFVLGADVDSASRVKQQETSAFSEQPFGDGDLLLVAAGERPNSGPKRAPIDVDAFKDRLNRRSPAVTTDHNPAGTAIVI